MKTWIVRDEVFEDLEDALPVLMGEEVDDDIQDDVDEFMANHSVWHILTFIMLVQKQLYLMTMGKKH